MADFTCCATAIATAESANGVVIMADDIGFECNGRL